MEQKSRISKINVVFLATVLISIAAGYINFGKITTNRVVLLLISQVILIIPAVVYLIKEKQSYTQTVRLKPIRVSTFLKLILFTIFVTPVMTLVNALSQLFAENAIANTMTGITNENAIATSLIAIALIPCIFEESVYRGLFYNEYRKVSPIKGMLVSALLFGLLHGNINQCSYAIVMGLIFALVIEATDSILSTMIMHFIINANSVVALYLYPELLRMLKNAYDTAQQSGNTELAQMITEAVGGTDFTMEALLEQSSELMNTVTVGDVFSAYGMSALVCGIIAFFIYRSIARGEGQYEHVKSIFSRSNNTVVNTDVPYGESRVKIFTLPLIIAVVILVISMISYELMVRNII